MSTSRVGAVGAAIERRDARDKVTGRARYAYDHHIDNVAFAAIVQAQAARGRITDVDASRALELPGVITVLSFKNAPTLQPIENGELMLFQGPEVSYYGQIVAAVVAERPEIARQGAALVHVSIAPAEHDVELRVDHPREYRPNHAAFRPPETSRGDVSRAVSGADVVVEATYTTPAEHNMPMEPHASLAVWDDGSLTVYDSAQYPHGTKLALAGLLNIAPDRVRVQSRMVGGGFGSKGSPRPHLVVAVLAAQLTARPVKIALTRREMFPITGHRSPTIQMMRLAANRDGQLTAFEHVAYAQTSRLNEFCEPSTTGTRVMYAAEHRFDTNRLVRLDVPSPGFCRAPGEAPGFFALESAVDELAVSCQIDPVELRIRNEPDRDPSDGLPFSSRSLIECLQQGADEFGWWRRIPIREGRILVGHGVASSMYPSFQMPSSARVTAQANGRFLVEIGAADVGTGARTVLAQIAADELGVDAERVDVDLGDSDLPYAIGAFGSLGTGSWGHAIVLACEDLCKRLELLGAETPPEGTIGFGDTTAVLQERQPYSRNAFGAQFVEVSVDADTNEVRVTRMLGAFAAGRIVNPRLARSQAVGGMTWGISMALHEHAVMDRRYGDFVTKDLASYHVAVAADVPDIEVVWIDETDEHLNPVGTKGLGEIGIVGTAAAIANAVYDATGKRIRALPLTPDRLVRA